MMSFYLYYLIIPDTEMYPLILWQLTQNIKNFLAETFHIMFMF